MPTLFAFFEIAFSPSKRVSMRNDEKFCSIRTRPLCKNTTTESQTTKLLYKKHDEKSPKLVHEIKFVYESPSCSSSPDDIGETDNTPPLTALSDDTDIPAAQRSCLDFKDTVEYLDTGTLPDSDVAARKVILESDQYTIVVGKQLNGYIPDRTGSDRTGPVGPGPFRP